VTTDSPTNDTSSPAQTERSRFPYVTAYMGLYAVTFLIALPIALLMLPASVTKTTLFRLTVVVGGFIINYIVFRWAVKKHILPYVSVDTTVLQNDGNRFSLKNPYLMGAATYTILYALAQTCIWPLKEWLEAQLSPAPNFLLSGLVLDGLVGFLPFVIAAKYVVFKPYRLRRLLPFLGLLVVFTFSLAYAIALAQVRQEWAFRNQVYCELLKPGMTKAEVDAALKPLGLRHQINWGLEVLHGPTIPQADTFTEPTFDSPDIEYGLLLVLGYDSNDHLVMVGHRQPLSFDYEPIKCPLPFR
jgi:hypothetical protein